MRKSVAVLMCIMGILLCTHAHAATISLTAQDVVNVMSANGANLDNATYQWGIWAVRVMPIVGGSGLYTITGGSTTQAGWGVSAPNGAFGSAPYSASNSAWFWDASGAEVAGNPPNPLYIIVSKDASTFTSYFGNTVTAVLPTSTFTFTFDLGAGATWNGAYQFVVDGSKYTAGTTGTPGTWVADYFGGYGTGGDLVANMGAGYHVVPIPGAMLLLAPALGAIGLVRRRLGKKA